MIWKKLKFYYFRNYSTNMNWLGIFPKNLKKNKIIGILESIIDKPTQRMFPYSIKLKLFNDNPVCAISGQKILKIEDSEVDHIIAYSKGGETTLENAQLVLRHFNRVKSNNTQALDDRP